MFPHCNHRRIASLAFAALVSVSSFSASAATNLVVSVEAVIQGGSSANNDIDEAAAGYLHVKYSAAPFDVSRKAYFQFDLAGVAFDPNAAALFTVYFSNTYQQRVQLWGLNQAAILTANQTWNLAPANETTSNNLLTNSSPSATRIGTDFLIPTSGTPPFSVTIPRLGDFVFSNRVTLAISGVADAGNNSAGLRMTRNQAVLALGTVTNQTTPTDYDVYLIGGQSNADGRGLVSDLTGPLAVWNQPQNNVRIFYANPGTNTTFSFTPQYETGWQILAPGFSVPPGFSGAFPSGDFGPELSFARTLADADSTRHVVLIKVTKSGVNLYSNWKPTSGYMYMTYTNTVRKALAALVSEGSTYTLRGMIWHQGESDTSGTAETSYETNMVRLISSVRGFLGVTNLPFVVGEIATNKSDIVRAAEYNLGQTIPYVGFASSDGLQTFEGTHFISPDVLELGRRFAAGLEVPPLTFVSFRQNNGAILFDCSGLAVSRCTVLITTNLSVAATNWIALTTNVFDAAGRWSFTNNISAGTKFYRLRGN